MQHPRPRFYQARTDCRTSSCFRPCEPTAPHRPRRLHGASKDLFSGGGYRKAWAKWAARAGGLRTARNVARALLGSRLLAALNGWRAAAAATRAAAARLLEAALVDYEGAPLQYMMKDHRIAAAQVAADVAVDVLASGALSFGRTGVGLQFASCCHVT